MGVSQHEVAHATTHSRALDLAFTSWKRSFLGNPIRGLTETS